MKYAFQFRSLSHRLQEVRQNEIQHSQNAPTKAQALTFDLT